MPISNATLYFGLATAGHWVTPQHNCNGFEVKIDLNSDDRPDYTIINGNTGSYAAGDVDAWWNFTDALISVVRSEATGHLSAAGPLNKLEPTVRDTSPFLNGVMVHAVRAADLGLTDNRIDRMAGRWPRRMGWVRSCAVDLNKPAGR